MASILKHVAIAAGAGLGLGLTAIAVPPARKRLPGAPEPVRPPAEDVLDVEPLLDRIEVLERRLDLVLSASPVPARSDSAAPDSESLAALEARFDAKLEDLRRQMDAALPGAIEAAVDKEVSRRMESVEKVLAGQAVAINELRNQEALTDENLQRLIDAVERLVVRGAGPPPAAANGSFQDHLTEAMAPPKRSRIFGL